MERNRVSITFVVIIILAIITFLVVSSYIGAPPSSYVKLDVNPEGIPSSGTWTVMSRLVTPGNMTEPYVNATVKMTATLTDGSQATLTKLSSNGSVSFTPPSNTTAVRFDANYKSYSGTVSISGPIVISESSAEGYAAGGLVAPLVAYVGGLTRVNFGTSRIRRVVLGLLFPVAIFWLPLYYLVAVFPHWYSKGWAPSTVLGLDLYWLVIVPIISTAVSLVVALKWPATKA